MYMYINIDRFPWRFCLTMPHHHVYVYIYIYIYVYIYTKHTYMYTYTHTLPGVKNLKFVFSCSEFTYVMLNSPGPLVVET